MPMDPMTALMLGQMVVGAAGTMNQAQQQAAQALAQKYTFMNQEFARQVQVDAQNEQINANNAQQILRNRQSAQAIGTQAATEEFVADQNFRSAQRNMSINYAKIQDAAKSQFGGKSMSMNSGSAKAILNMSEENFLRMSENATYQQSFAQKSIDNRRIGQLRGLDSYLQGNVLFVPGIDSSADPNAIIQAGATSANLQMAIAAVGVGMSAKG